MYKFYPQFSRCIWPIQHKFLSRRECELGIYTATTEIIFNDAPILFMRRKLEPLKANISHLSGQESCKDKNWLDSIHNAWVHTDLSGWTHWNFEVFLFPSQDLWNCSFIYSAFLFILPSQCSMHSHAFYWNHTQSIYELSWLQKHLIIELTSLISE